MKFCKDIIQLIISYTNGMPYYLPQFYIENLDKMCWSRLAQNPSVPLDWIINRIGIKNKCSVCGDSNICTTYWNHISKRNNLPIEFLLKYKENIVKTFDFYHNSNCGKFFDIIINDYPENHKDIKWDLLFEFQHEWLIKKHYILFKEKGMTDKHLAKNNNLSVDFLSKFIDDNSLVDWHYMCMYQNVDVLNYFSDKICKYMSEKFNTNFKNWKDIHDWLYGPYIMPHNISWKYISKRCNTIKFWEKNYDNIDWLEFSFNPMIRQRQDKLVKYLINHI